MTLNEWFQRNANVPLTAAAFLVSLVWVVLFAGVLNENSRRQEAGVHQLANLLSLSIDQKNRVLTESLLESSHVSLEADSAVICEGERALISSNAGNRACAPTHGSFLYPVITYQIPGGENARLVVIFSNLKGKSSIWLFLLAGLLFTALSYVLLYKIKHRFWRDIFHPLQRGILDNEPMPISEFEELRKKRKILDEAKEREAAFQAVLENKLKVVHNIKSPLRTLRFVQEKISTLIPVRESKLLEGVAESINKILSDQQGPISETSVGVSKFALEPAMPQGRELLLFSDFLEETVAHKSAEYAGANHATISLSGDGAAGIFVDAVKHELRAVLSNVINNSIDAIGDRRGEIKIQSSVMDDHLKVRITDNGCGIPRDVAEKIFDRDFTFGKKAGSGFGLYHARQYLTQWGGSIAQSSGPGLTTFEITLPVARVPAWFVSHIDLSQKKHIVILDDDTLIHSVWRERFSLLDLRGVCVHHALSEQEFEMCLHKISSEISESFILCDYDLNSIRNGLDVIESYGVANIAAMVTNSFGSDALKKQCTRRGLKILPKPFIHFVPIST